MTLDDIDLTTGLYVLMSSSGDRGELEYAVSLLNQDDMDYFSNGIDNWVLVEEDNHISFGYDDIEYSIFKIEKGVGYKYVFNEDGESFVVDNSVEEGLISNSDDVFEVSDVIEWSVLIN